MLFGNVRALTRDLNRLNHRSQDAIGGRATAAGKECQKGSAHMSVTVHLSRLLLAGAAVGALATSAVAQGGGEAPTDAEETTTTTVDAQTTAVDEDEEEIVVTATRRTTRLQKTPIAITAVPEQVIEKAGIKSTQDLQQVVPALAFPQSESNSSVTARIRGVGTQGSNPGLESAVGIFVDGVYRARNAVGFGDWARSSGSKCYAVPKEPCSGGIPRRVSSA